MEYLGCRAKIEFDGENFFCVIENISDLVTFESDSAEDLECEFHAAVEDYMAFRKLTGKDSETFAAAV